MIKRVSDLTVEEFREILREELQKALREMLDEKVKSPAQRQHSALNMPVDDLGPWPEDLSLRREDMYGDDER